MESMMIGLFAGIVIGFVLGVVCVFAWGGKVPTYDHEATTAIATDLSSAHHKLDELLARAKV